MNDRLQPFNLMNRAGTSLRRLPEWSRFLIGLVTMAVATAARRGLPTSYCDFNDYYFGGAIERSGTYTDATSVLTLAHASGQVTPFDGPYGAPTLVALLFQPLSLVPIAAAHLAWDLLVAVAVCIGARKAVASHTWPLVVAVLGASQSGGEGLMSANASLLTFALVSYAYGCLRDGQDARAGTVLAVVACFKLYPAYLFLALIAHRRRQALTWFFLTCVGLLLLTVPALGPGDVWPAVRKVVSLGASVTPNPANTTLPGVLLELTGSPVAAGATSLLLLVAGTLAMLPSRWNRSNLAANQTFALAAAIAVVGMPLAWAHYLLLLLPAAIVVWAIAPSRTVRRVGIGAFLAAIYSPSIYLSPVNDPRPGTLLSVSAAMVLIACLLIASKRRNETGTINSPVRGPMEDLDARAHRSIGP